MGVFGRAGNLLRGFLRKPLEALEKSPAERQLERELEDKAALERARANIEEADREAGPVAKPGAPDDDGGPKKRRMGPE